MLPYSYLLKNDMRHLYLLECGDRCGEIDQTWWKLL